MPLGQIGGENIDGVLMYIITKGTGQTYQVMNSIAQDVWYETEHPNSSNFGVAYTDIIQHPDAEILSQTTITGYPTILFCKVENGEIRHILSKIKGSHSKQRVKREYLNALNSFEAPAKEGDNASLEKEENGILDWFKMPIGYSFDCNKSLPTFICSASKFFVLIIVLIIILIIIKIIK